MYIYEINIEFEIIYSQLNFQFILPPFYFTFVIVFIFWYIYHLYPYHIYHLYLTRVGIVPPVRAKIMFCPEIKSSMLISCTRIIIMRHSIYKVCAKIYVSRHHVICVYWQLRDKTQLKSFLHWTGIEPAFDKCLTKHITHSDTRHNVAVIYNNLQPNIRGKHEYVCNITRLLTLPVAVTSFDRTMQYYTPAHVICGSDVLWQDYAILHACSRYLWQWRPSTGLWLRFQSRLLKL